MPLPTIETPKYETKIPSTGKRVSYRPYLVKEEKILMLAMESENQTQIISAIKDIIRACTFEKVNPDNLSTFDLEFLFLKLRSKSVGEISKVGLKCEKCTKTTQLEINLDAITVDTSNIPSNKIQLTDKIGVMMSWPKIDTVNSISDDSKNNMNGVLEVIASCIESI